MLQGAIELGQPSLDMSMGDSEEAEADACGAGAGFGTRAAVWDQPQGWQQTAGANSAVVAPAHDTAKAAAATEAALSLLQQLEAWTSVRAAAGLPPPQGVAGGSGAKPAGAADGGVEIVAFGGADWPELPGLEMDMREPEEDGHNECNGAPQGEQQTADGRGEGGNKETKPAAADGGSGGERGGSSGAKRRAGGPASPSSAKLSRAAAPEEISGTGAGAELRSSGGGAGGTGGAPGAPSMSALDRLLAAELLQLGQLGCSLLIEDATEAEQAMGPLPAVAPSNTAAAEKKGGGGAAVAALRAARARREALCRRFIDQALVEGARRGRGGGLLELHALMERLSQLLAGVGAGAGVAAAAAGPQRGHRAGAAECRRLTLRGLLAAACGVPGGGGSGTDRAAEGGAAEAGRSGDGSGAGALAPQRVFVALLNLATQNNLAAAARQSGLTVPPAAARPAAGGDEGSLAGAGNTLRAWLPGPIRLAAPGDEAEDASNVVWID
jgi:hypothetical protein